MDQDTGGAAAPEGLLEGSALSDEQKKELRLYAEVSDQQVWAEPDFAAFRFADLMEMVNQVRRSGDHWKQWFKRPAAGYHGPVGLAGFVIFFGGHVKSIQDNLGVIGDECNSDAEIPAQ
jgi:hypothetical protein